MMTKQFLKFTGFLSFIFLTNSAYAHTGSHEVSGFISGLTHPFLGLDHLLVMFGVGLWASRLNKQQAAITVINFLLFMLIGAVLALLNVDIQGVEYGILASVLITGGLLLSLKQFSLLLMNSLFASFALMHGFAHGLEMPIASEPALYGLGFLTATLILQLTGLSVGKLLKSQAVFIRITGTITSGLGLWLLINA
jgi:urease accessory protein